MSAWRESLLLIIAVLLAYANAFNGTFQFDDYNVIVNFSPVHEFTSWMQDVYHGIRPLLKLSYTLNWTMGMGAASFLWLNVCIHMLNTLLVWRLAEALLVYKSGIEIPRGLALLGALFFALHPASTEAVTYISGRSASLMTLFYLLGLLAYEHGLKNQDWRWLHLATPACMLLAILTKEVAVTFPAALLLWSWYRKDRPGEILQKQWSSWLLLFGGGVFFFWHDGYRGMMEHSLLFNTLPGNIATQLLALVYLLRQCFAPFWLNIDPDLPVLKDFSGMWPHLLVLLAYVMLLVWNREKRRWLVFALLWLLLQVVPLYLFLPRLDVANDRQLYLAAWPMMFALPALVLEWMPRRLGLMLVSAALIFFAILIHERNKDYRSEVALWEATVRLSPEKPRAHNNLGYAYKMAGRRDDATREFVIAWKLASDLN